MIKWGVSSLLKKETEIDQDMIYKDFIEAFDRKDINAIQGILDEDCDFTENIKGEEYNLLEYVLTNPPSMDLVKQKISEKQKADEERGAESKSAYNEYLDLIGKVPTLGDGLSYYFKTLELLYKKFWSGDRHDSIDFNFNISEHINEIVRSHMIKWLEKNDKVIPEQLNKIEVGNTNLNKEPLGSTTINVEKTLPFKSSDPALQESESQSENPNPMYLFNPTPTNRVNLSRNYPLGEGGGGNKKKSNKRIKRKKN